ncbi:unnamed protein product [Jaminaea pallidilutea]
MAASQKLTPFALQAFPAWRDTQAWERAKLMLKLADMLEARIAQLAVISSLDTGMLVSAAQGFDLASLVELLRYYAGSADKIQGKTISGKKTMNYTVREPHGVCGLILPWNFPNLILGWKLAPALAAGNTVIVKPSEIMPLTALCLGEISKAAGFPDGVINVIAGPGNVGEAMARHPGIRKIAFTGSGATGCAIAVAAAQSNLKHVSLELGGKGAVMVDEEANVDKAAFWSSLGIYFHQGQICATGSRVFVHSKLQRQFIEAFRRNLDEPQYGDPLQGQNIADIVGPLASSQHCDKVAQSVQAGKNAGIEWVEGDHGGQPPNRNYLPRGFFFDPPSDSDVFTQELFGPVACITPFDNLSEALQLANASEYGLTANVFSRNIDTALKIAAELQAGTVWINCTALLDASTPFGGIKQSGNGRDGGDKALDLYLSTKTVKILLEPLPRASL